MAFLDESGLERLWYQIVSKLGTKVDAIDGKSLSENDYTTAEKEKLAGIEIGATNVIVDSELNTSSTNPVQNKVIQTQFESLQNQLDVKLSGTVTVAQGGTGAVDASGARTNLDVYSKDETVAKIEELLGVIENGSY